MATAMGAAAASILLACCSTLPYDGEAEDMKNGEEGGQAQQGGQQAEEAEEAEEAAAAEEAEEAEEEEESLEAAWERMQGSLAAGKAHRLAVEYSSSQ